MAKNIEINIKGSDGNYEVLYPKTNSSTTVINQNIINQFGLTEGSGLEDVLGELGKYNEYWWRRRKSASYTYVEERTNITEAVSIVDREIGSTGVLGEGYFEWSKNININISNGAFSLNNPVKVYAWDTESVALLQNVLNNLEKNIPCYIKTFGEEYTNIYYLPENSTFNLYAKQGFTVCSYSSGNCGIHLLAKSDSYTNNFVVAQKVSTHIEDIPAGEFEYFHSINRSAYPDSGSQNGYEYEYLGVPFDNIPISGKIEFGRYLGNGIYGESHPNILTFKFSPKFVVVKGYQPTVFLRDAKTGATWSGNCEGGSYSCSFQGNSLEWYYGDEGHWYGSAWTSSNLGAEAQLNTAYQFYYYIAFC